jgi:molecular chaperone DnaK
MTAPAARVIGIDLGTTNTVGALGGEVLQASDGTTTLASVVAFPPNGATLIGALAKRRRAIDPRNTISSAKRLMGKGFRSYSASQFRTQYPHELVETTLGGCGFRTRAGVIGPSQVASYVIGKLLATHSIAPTSCDAVIAVPASFDQAGLQATVQSAEQAGLRNVTTLLEPLATARAYLRRTPERWSRVAVYDFGGGTFDLAIVDASTPEPRLIAHGGDAYLGGDDLDKAIADWVAQRTLERHGWDLKTDAEVYDRLMVQAERAKVRLCIAPQTRIELAQVDPGAVAAGDALVLTRDDLALLAAPLLSRTFLVCDEVLRTAGLSRSQVDAVFLAGGATLLPSVREGATGYFGAPVRAAYDPMQVVSIGASLTGGPN